MGQAKVAKVAQSPSEERSARVGKAPESFEDRNPSWRMRDVDFDGPWGWSGLNRDTLVGELYAKLKQYETMTWAEIANAAGGKSHGNNSHFVEVSSLCRDAQRRLAELKKDDADNLFSLRLSGKIRVWGLRFGNVLHILWYDPEHQVCPSSKR